MNHAIEMEIQQEAVENAAAGGDDHSSLAVKNDTSVDDGEDIEKGEYAFDATGRVDDGGNEHRIQEELKIGQSFEVFQVSQEDDVKQGQGIDGDDEEIMGCLDAPEVGSSLFDLNKNGSAQEK